MELHSPSAYCWSCRYRLIGSAIPLHPSERDRFRTRHCELVNPLLLDPGVFPAVTAPRLALLLATESTHGVTPPSELDHLQATAKLLLQLAVPLMRFGPLQRSRYVRSTVPGFASPGRFRPQGFAPSRRLTPSRTVRPCFMPVTLMGLSPPEPSPLTEAVAPLDARNLHDVVLPLRCGSHARGISALFAKQRR
jgi:hypothetical protein